jgi:hypothetical protein
MQKAMLDAQSPPTILGLPLGEAAILMAPVLLYAGFTVYRTAFNPAAKLSNFFFAIATVAVFGNIAAILVFKIRFF